MATRQQLVATLVRVRAFVETSYARMHTRRLPPTGTDLYQEWLIAVGIALLFLWAYGAHLIGN